MLLDGETEGLKENCPRGTEEVKQPLIITSYIKGYVDASRETHIPSQMHSAPSPEATRFGENKENGDAARGSGHLSQDYLDDVSTTAPLSGR